MTPEPVRRVRVRRVRVRLLPWRPRLRRAPDGPDVSDAGLFDVDDLGVGLTIGLVALALVAVPFLAVLLLFSLELALVVLLAPLLVVVQLLGLRPWYLRLTPVSGEATWVCVGSTREMLAARRYYRSLRR